MERHPELTEIREAITDAYFLMEEAYANGETARRVCPAALRLREVWQRVFGISTSGNSENILNTAVVAKAMDIKVVGPDGRMGSKL